MTSLAFVDETSQNINEKARKKNWNSTIKTNYL